MGNKRMSLRKWNKKKLGLRILTFPLKLLFQVVWGLLSSLIYSFQWIKNGSQELVYGDDHEVSLVKLIEQNSKIIQELNKKPVDHDALRQLCAFQHFLGTNYKDLPTDSTEMTKRAILYSNGIK